MSARTEMWKWMEGVPAECAESYSWKMYVCCVWPNQTQSISYNLMAEQLMFESRPFVRGVYSMFRKPEFPLSHSRTHIQKYTQHIQCKTLFVDFSNGNVTHSFGVFNGFLDGMRRVTTMADLYYIAFGPPHKRTKHTVRSLG